MKRRLRLRQYFFVYGVVIAFFGFILLIAAQDVVVFNTGRDLTISIGCRTLFALFLLFGGSCFTKKERDRIKNIRMIIKMQEEIKNGSDNS